MAASRAGGSHARAARGPRGRARTSRAPKAGVSRAPSHSASAPKAAVSRVRSHSASAHKAGASRVRSQLASAHKAGASRVRGSSVPAREGRAPMGQRRSARGPGDTDPADTDPAGTDPADTDPAPAATDRAARVREGIVRALGRVAIDHSYPHRQSVTRAPSRAEATPNGHSDATGSPLTGGHHGRHGKAGNQAPARDPAGNRGLATSSIGPTTVSVIHRASPLNMAATAPVRDATRLRVPALPGRQVTGPAVRRVRARAARNRDRTWSDTLVRWNTPVLAAAS